MPFSHRVTVRFSDTDAMGHVNNARFVSYLEEARIALFTAMDGDLLGTGLILARTEIDYRRPIQLSSEPVVVEVWVTLISNKSFALGYRMKHQGELVAEANTVLAAYDYAAGRSRPLSESERDALEAWQEGTP